MTTKSTNIQIDQDELKPFHLDLPSDKKVVAKKLKVLEADATDLFSGEEESRDWQH